MSEFLTYSQGFPDSSDGKESACNEEELRYNLWVRKPLEKGMATHSNILAWRIPWIKELGRLQSMGFQELDMTNTFISFTHSIRGVKQN